jgi:Transposase IS200 like.
MKRDFGRRPPRPGARIRNKPSVFRHVLHARTTKDEVHTAFVLFAKRAEETFNVAVGRYVIMPDHVHLFVRGDCNFRLGPWIGALKQALAKAATLSQAKGQIWEEGFFDHVLRSNESYSQKWNYVRENPVRAGLVKLAADWPLQGEIAHIDRA